MKCRACPSTRAALRKVWLRGRVQVVALCDACRSDVDRIRQRQRNADRAKRPMGVVTKSPDQK